MSEITEKDTLKKEELENPNDELFNAFNPEDELSIIGGSGSATGNYTHTPQGNDFQGDVVITF